MRCKIPTRDVAVFGRCHALELQEVSVEIGKVLKTRHLSDHDDLIIGGIEHPAGLSDADTVQEHHKTMPRDRLKIPAKRNLGHAGHFGRLGKGQTFAEILDDVIDNFSDTGLLAATFGLDQLGRGEGFLFGMFIEADKKPHKGQNALGPLIVADRLHMAARESGVETT